VLLLQNKTDDICETLERLKWCQWMFSEIQLGLQITKKLFFNRIAVLCFQSACFIVHFFDMLYEQVVQQSPYLPKQHQNAAVPSARPQLQGPSPSFSCKWSAASVCDNVIQPLFTGQHIEPSSSQPLYLIRSLSKCYACYSHCLSSYFI